MNFWVTDKMIKNDWVSKTTGLTIIILAGLIFSCFQIGNASETLVVPDAYSSIQEAIDDASSGDMIFVKTGVYHENLLVDKSVNLVGENKENTIVIGTGNVTRGQQTVVTLASENIKISGFTIKSQNYSKSNLHASGISVEADKCEIANNIISNTYYGIFCSTQSEIIIAQNQITSNLKDGIRFCGGSLNTISQNNITENAKGGIALEGYSITISENQITNNDRGIGMGASYSLVFGNNIANNSEFNFFFAGSYNIICSNNISDSNWGVYFSPYFAAPMENKFYHNNFINNQVNVGATSTYNVQEWDNDFPSGGNYWNDYSAHFPQATEVNDSGIWETKYEIAENHTDRYPLVWPFDISNDAAPSLCSPPIPEPNSIVVCWPFDEVQPNGVTPDEIGLNFAVVGTSSGDVSYTPTLVEGKQDKAFSFDGAAYVNTPILPHLEISKEITIDVWVNVQQYKNVKYNNILVECERTRAGLPNRTVGLAINGEEPNENSNVPQGAIIAYVSTENGGLNEITTTESVVSLNQWMHIVFTRSLSTGMHIYVNGQEQDITVTSGVQNPEGDIQKETELYVGHDAVCEIDEIKVYNYVTEQAIEQNNGSSMELYVILIAAIGIIAVLGYVKIKR